MKPEFNIEENCEQDKENQKQQWMLKWDKRIQTGLLCTLAILGISLIIAELFVPGTIGGICAATIGKIGTLGANISAKWGIVTQAGKDLVRWGINLFTTATILSVLIYFARIGISSACWWATQQGGKLLKKIALKLKGSANISLQEVEKSTDRASEQLPELSSQQELSGSEIVVPKPQRSTYYPLSASGREPADSEVLLRINGGSKGKEQEILL